MSYRYMRVIVMFDLPVATASDRREYTHFRKYLIKNGFLMMQESIYCKLAQNSTAVDLIIQNIRKNKPPSGLVQTLKITEKQFSRIEYIVGKKESEVLDSDERIVIL
ncbi:CRISPR-associated endonuclease Cas2 [Eubacterium ventriosum]|uniref:CRISPR-associated endonuclease Cas2 n=1 Tax=Eubacterium ventriosum TaxID=39496 RepID=UPI0039F50A13